MVCLKPLYYREWGIKNAQHSLASNRSSKGTEYVTHRSKEKFGIYMVIISTIVGLPVTSRGCVGGQEQKAYLSSGN